MSSSEVERITMAFRELPLTVQMQMAAVVLKDAQNRHISEDGARDAHWANGEIRWTPREIVYIAERWADADHERAEREEAIAAITADLLAQNVLNPQELATIIFHAGYRKADK